MSLNQSFSASDVLADIAEFEVFLDLLVAFEDFFRTETFLVPRVHYIRLIVYECLEPMCTDMPEIFDFDRGVSYCEAERAHLFRRTTSLLNALKACQTLNMCESELKSYCEAPALTHEEMQNTRLFVQLANDYNVQFRQVQHSSA
jgi:hypothetical protein